MAIKKRKVLVFPAGTEIGLEIFHALKSCKEIQLVAAGQDISNHAQFIYPEYYVLPSIYENNWLEALNELCIKLKIDYIFPAYDDVIVALSEAKDRLHATAISSPALTCKITRSKSQTYRYLADKVRVPILYESPNQVIKFPVFVKPDKGQGSLGVTKVTDIESLKNSLASLSDPIICEYLPGEEYTVDCFSDREKGLLFSGARSRRRIRNGIAVNSLTESIPELEQMARKISQTLDLWGAWFFQVKRAENGEFALLEVAPRIAGSMAVHRVTGINFPLLSIFEAERLPISILTNAIGNVELDRALSNRYRHTMNYSTLYVDLDDTLLLNNQVNTQVITLLFQCINQGKTIILLTRHRENLNDTLSKHRLLGLFDEIIHLRNGEKKSSYIKSTDALFLDDSFAERLEVSTRCNIPTLDCSMIEILTEMKPISTNTNSQEKII